MTKRKLLTPEELRKVFVCNAVAGKLYWREREPAMFSDGGNGRAANADTWNKRWAGSEALRSGFNGRYGIGAVFNKCYSAHRVIWAMHTGEWPTNQIDHINHNPSDNRIENLRAASQQENLKNASIRSDNTSGHVGVYWNKADERWIAQIMTHGKRKYLGSFINIEDAVLARTAASMEYGYHKNHGDSVLLA